MELNIKTNPTTTSLSELAKKKREHQGSKSSAIIYIPSQSLPVLILTHIKTQHIPKVFSYKYQVMAFCQDPSLLDFQQLAEQCLRIQQISDNNIQISAMSSKELDRIRFNRYQEKLIYSSASMKHLSFHRETQHLRLEKTMISLPLSRTAQEIKTYQWRVKTEFPIVKVTQFSIKHSNTQNSLFQVEMEHYPTKLTDLKDLPLFKILYLLKEALIGFERLFHVQGAFMPTARMIVLNAANKCKVWLNQNLASNQLISYRQQEHDFLTVLYQLFQAQAYKRKNTRLFFQEIGSQRTFFGALAFIENYARTNKITISSACKIGDRDSFKGVERKNFGATLTMNQPPKSLQKNQTMRTSLEYASKNPLLKLLPNFSIQQNQEEEHEEISIKLKKSQETATEAFDKKSYGLQTEDHFFLENTLFKDSPSPQHLARSQFQPKLQSRIAFARKFSGQYPEIKGCLSPSQSRCTLVQDKKLQPRLQKPKWNENSFTNCEIQEGVNVNVNGFFTQNKWEKTLNGLFQDSSVLKTSVHKGKEQRLTGKFDLLDKLGKAIKQSFIHQEMESSIQY